MEKKPITSVLISGIIAFLLYGSWAVYANNDYGLFIALRSGFAQGLISLFVTMIMTFAMEQVFAKVKLRGLRFIFTAFGPLTILLGLMIFVHWLIGTPQILKTVLPSITVGTLYCCIYTCGLFRVLNKKYARRLFYTLGGLVIICIISVIIAVIVIQRITRTQTNGIIYVKGLQGPVFVQRDQYGVPHILAEKSDQDAFFALGFVQAQDRLWQMEFQRHVTSGTLSEIFGSKTVPQDEFLRTWGFYDAAKAAWPAFDPSTKAIVTNYTAGINAYIQLGNLPLQILLLHYHPTPWTVYDSIAWQKMMAWQLQTSWEQKIKNQIIATAYGANKIPSFMPPYPASAPTTLSSADLIQSGILHSIPITMNKEPTPSTPGNLPSLSTTLALAQEVHNELGYMNVPGKGSNAWVVSGKFTQSGLPLLANDTHLQLTAPSLWYLVEMRGPTLHVTGASIPGLPAIVVGHNDNIAWGVTNGYNDAQELFIIPSAATTTTMGEVINVKGEKPIHFNVEISNHGPIISNVTPHLKDLPMRLAMQWPALQANDTTLQSFLDLQYAKNWADFTNALKYFVAPTQNFVYADTKGNIGYYYPGKLPIRKGYSGMLPVEAKYNWSGYIPFNALPHVYNPPEGFIATANNAVAPTSYPYSLTFRWPAPPYRVERIRDLLTHNGILTPDKFMAFQQDTTSYFWQDLQPSLLTTKPLDGASKEALTILSQWDDQFSLNSEGATIFAYWLQQFSSLWPKPLAFGDKWLEPLYLKQALADPKMQGYLSQTLSSAMQALMKERGSNPDNWQWGQVHHAVFNELGLGQSKLIGWIWQRSIPTPGGDYTVNVGTYDPHTFTQVEGATYRQVIDLANLAHSYYIQPLGQSENIFSKYYSNLMKMWRNGQYVQMTQYDQPCNPNSQNCLELLPLK